MDGQGKLFYHPRPVALEYWQDKSVIVRLLHILKHGLLGHFQNCAGRRTKLFSTAADLEVTEFLLRYARPFLRLKGEKETCELLDILRTGAAVEFYENVEDYSAGRARIIKAVELLCMDLHCWIDSGDVSGSCSREKSAVSGACNPG